MRRGQLCPRWRGRFQRQDFAAAIDAIESVYSERERICGSRAQLDLVEFTLLKAYLAAGRRDDASRLLRARRPGPRGITVAGLAAATPVFLLKL